VQASLLDQPPGLGLALLEDYLGLSTQQRRAVSQIDARFAATRPALREETLKARDKLLAVMSDPKSTSDQAVAAARSFGVAQQAMQINTIEYTFELRKHLSPAQKTKLASVMSRGLCALTCDLGRQKGLQGRGQGPGECDMGPRGMRGGCPMRGGSR